MANGGAKVEPQAPQVLKMSAGRFKYQPASIAFVGQSVRHSVRHFAANARLRGWLGTLSL